MSFLIAGSLFRRCRPAVLHSPSLAGHRQRTVGDISIVFGHQNSLLQWGGWSQSELVAGKATPCGALAWFAAGRDMPTGLFDQHGDHTQPQPAVLAGFFSGGKRFEDVFHTSDVTLAPVLLTASMT